VEIFCGTKNFGSFVNNLPEEALMHTNGKDAVNFHHWKSYHHNQSV
jgi:hypothetical protein